MDFEESPEELAFREEARAWLKARAKRREPGSDPEHFYSSNDTSAEADAAHVRACKTWQRTLYEAGWAGIAWPKEFGGRGGAGWQQRIFNEEQSRFDVAAGVFTVGIAMAGPTIIALGHRRAAVALSRADAERRARVVPAVLGAGRGIRSRGTAHAVRRATASSGSSTGRRSGPRARTTATGGCCSRAPISMRRSTKGSPRSCSTCTRPASRCGRYVRSTAWRTSTRSSSPTCPAQHVPARPGQRGLAGREHDALQRTGDDRQRRPRRLARHRHARAAQPARRTTRSCASSSRTASRACS